MPSRTRGFTLIEIMIAVAIVAILAAIALPAFNEQVRKSRRSDAMSQAGQVQLVLERWRADCPTYAASAPCGTYPAATLPTSNFYDFNLVANAAGFTLTASPKGAQSGDRCGNLVATANGKPSWATADCNQ
jgi:type IV pilus assembly protein PilE